MWLIWLSENRVKQRKIKSYQQQARISLIPGFELGIRKFKLWHSTSNGDTINREMYIGFTTITPHVDTNWVDGAPPLPYLSFDARVGIVLNKSIK